MNRRKNLYRRLSISFLLLLAAYVAGNFLVWKVATEEMLAGKSAGGNLVRVGYIAGSKMTRHNHDDLPRRHLEFETYDFSTPVDLVTIGDSFSNECGGGLNRFYQDYIATLQNLNVLNIRLFQHMEPMPVLAALANNGYLDKVKPRYLLLESLEQFSFERFAPPADLSFNVPLEELRKRKQNSYATFQPGVKFINSGNMDYLLYNFLYLFSDHAFFCKTYKMKLDRPLFTVPNRDLLLFHRDDLRRMGLYNEKSVRAINDNLNRVADLLAAKGIKFYFMPVPDKYNLYREFIVDNPYPPSIFFEELRKLPKRYTLIDTKAILLDEVRKGEKDIYYADDTHWSWKAARKVFETFRFR